jgi:hypothetical protein
MVARQDTGLRTVAEPTFKGAIGDLGNDGVDRARCGVPPVAGDERKVERWAYQWRGGHDYLYFEIAHDRVVRADLVHGG